MLINVVPAIYRFKGNNQLDLEPGIGPNKCPKAFSEAEDKVGMSRHLHHFLGMMNSKKLRKLMVNGSLIKNEQITGYHEVVNWKDCFDPPKNVRLFVYFGPDGVFEQ